MAVKEFLLLGNPKLYEVCEPVYREELDQIRLYIADMHDTLIDFKRKYGAGRAIAAPQIGLSKRLVYMLIDTPVAFINPEIQFEDEEQMFVWDDCMSFPDLLVKVPRYKRCKITFYDLKWERQEMHVSGDLSELLQHEYDHLDGVLAVSKAVDANSFALRSQKHHLNL